MIIDHFDHTINLNNLIILLQLINVEDLAKTQCEHLQNLAEDQNTPLFSVYYPCIASL